MPREYEDELIHADQRDQIDPETRCENCGHEYRLHGDRYGCEVERADIQVAEAGWVAPGPCGCKDFAPEVVYEPDCEADL